MSQQKRLVVALGNPSFGDDGFGPAVMAALRARGGIDADLLEAGTDLVGSLDRFSAYDEVILLDAVVDPARAGQVGIVEEDELLSWPDAWSTCHAVSPVMTLKLFRTLHPGCRTRFSLVALFTAGIRAQPTFEC